MKRSILITLLLMLIASFSSFAQKAHITNNFDINGVKIGSMVTCSTIKSKFGEPTRIEEVGPGFMFFYYGENELCVINNELTSIIVYDNQFPVLTSIIEGGVRVGDNAEEVKAKIRQKTTGDIIETDKGFMVGTYDVHVSFDVSLRKITSISYHLESY